MVALKDVIQNRYFDGRTEAQERWTYSEIKVSNWNKEFPYQLMIVRETKTSSGTSVYARHNNRVFTLPIPPRSLTIQTPFGINNTVTIGGVVEEHAGAPVRFISFEGTTGVAPFRKRTARIGDSKTKMAAKIASSVFGGTIRAAQEVTETASALTSSHEYDTNIHKAQDGLSKKEDDQEGIPEYTTGYAQFHLLREFLERYAALKMKEENRDLRLALGIWKDNAVFLVTPVSFDLRRDARSPYSYSYSLRFKAWGRIEIQGGSPSNYEHKPPALDKDLMGEIYNRFDLARQTIEAGLDVVEAAISDATRVANLMREAGAILKLVNGAVLTVQDLPTDVATRMRNVYESTLRMYQPSWHQVKQNDWSAWGVGRKKKRGEQEQTSLNDTAASNLRSIYGLSLPESNEDIPIASIRFGPLASVIDDVVEDLQSNKQEKLIATRNELKRAVDDFAWKIGASSSTYDATFNNKRQEVSGREPSVDEIRVLWAMQEVLASIEQVAASERVDTDAIPSSLEYIAALASESDVDFAIPRGKLSVPLPYGFSLEQIALRYLGDATRWHEIASLNKLRSPYIDEEGFSLPFLLNGSDNKIFLSSIENLYQGQVIRIYSNTFSPEKRRIIGIEKAGSSIYEVSLDGDPDLGRFVVSDEASLHAYLPNTANSQNTIFIPTDIEPFEDYGATLPSEVNDFDNLLDIGGIDLLLSEDNDLVITSEGDARLAFGYSNIIQSARLKIATPKKALLHHPNFGLGVDVGTLTSEVDASELVKSIQESFENDPMFSEVTDVSVQKKGPTAQIYLNLAIAGSQKSIPLSFQV